MAEAAADHAAPWLDFAIEHRDGSLVLSATAVVRQPIAVLVGASGAGKTSLLRAIAGLLRPQHGHVTLAGVEISNSDQHIWLPPGQRGCGMAMQQPALFPHMTAQQNIAFGLHALSAAERRTRIAEMVTLFRLEEFVARRPGQLSGGEQQRVALARTLAPRPRVLLLDEPFAGLNTLLKQSILADLEAWLAAHATPVLYVTHDIAEAWRLAAHRPAEVLRIEAGRIVAQGCAADVLAEDRARLLQSLS